MVAKNEKELGRTFRSCVAIVGFLGGLSLAAASAQAGASTGPTPPEVSAAGPQVAAATPAPPETARTAGETQTPANDFVVFTYEVVHTWPHDRGAFTQGLVFLNGGWLESTGLNGESSLRRVELESGQVLQRIEVPADYFAEGLATLKGKLYQLTWRNQKGFVYDLASFRLEREFTYAGEGWGLATDGESLILSDGTNEIRFLDPDTFEEKRRIQVVANGKPVNRLNELEYIKGEIFANVWASNYVVRIDPATGKVAGVIDFTGLLPAEDRDARTDVLNGIAYDAAGDRLFVTGKRWPTIFEVRLMLKK